MRSKVNRNTSIMSRRGRGAEIIRETAENDVQMLQDWGSYFLVEVCMVFIRLEDSRSNASGDSSSFTISTP